MRIVQIVPYIRPGLGIPGVAWHLDRQFRALGVETETFTFDTARRGIPFAYPLRGLAGRIARGRRILWFQVVGSRRARQYLAERPDAVSICHSEAFAGDVFVYHGSMLRGLRAAGRSWGRILRNPILPIGYLFERQRFRGRTHRAVVTLTSRGLEDLREQYGRVRPRVLTIPNGVDLDVFYPLEADERRRLRAQFGLDGDDRVALFVGHDLPRKGVEHAIGALEFAPKLLLLVVGGDEQTIATAQTVAERLGVTARVLFLGPQHNVQRFFGVADMFVFPSGYEAFGLVLLEALASGLPVITTRVGCASDFIANGVNGFLVDQDAAQIGARMEQLAAADLDDWRSRARSSVEQCGWREVAEQYLALATELAEGRG